MFRSNKSRWAAVLALVGAVAAIFINLGDHDWNGFLFAQYSQNRFMMVLTNIGVAIGAWIIWYVFFRTMFWVFGSQSGKRSN